MKGIKGQRRQGDVLLHPIKAIPQNAARVPLEVQGNLSRRSAPKRDVGRTFRNYALDAGHDRIPTWSGCQKRLDILGGRFAC